jgi:mannose-6-phosphate isomerase-like protein (cupin superfamily)
MPIRTDEVVKIVPKGWGEERWLHNDELYCGKILIVNEGKRCSLHYHQLKTETFYIQQGRVRMELTDLKAGRETPPVILEEFVMEAGDTLLLKPGMVHRFTSLEGDALIFEFSTQHFDEDSHRIEKGD